MQATHVVHQGLPAVAKTLRKEVRRRHTRQEQDQFLLPVEQALVAMEGTHLLFFSFLFAPHSAADFMRS